MAAGVFWFLVRGIVQFREGLRRTPLASYPRCGKCRYDVSQQEGWICSECGADLKQVGILGGCSPADEHRLSDHAYAGAAMISSVVWAVSLLLVIRFELTWWLMFVPPALLTPVLVLMAMSASHERRAAGKHQRPLSLPREDPVADARGYPARETVGSG